VVPPTAASALLMKVAMFCSLAVGGRPPTYTRRACRVACCVGAASAAAAAAPAEDMFILVRGSSLIGHDGIQV